MDYHIRTVGEGDLPYLAQNLRGADMRELVGTYGPSMDPVEALRLSVSRSRNPQIIIGASGNPMFLFGIADWTDRSKLIWAVGTPEIASRAYHIPFLKASREVLAGWFEANPETHYFINMAHAGNTVHLKWLRWCHAELLPAMPYGPLLEEFNPFIIRRTSYV